MQLARTSEPAVKEALRVQTDQAQALGIFGAPTFITESGELFWGDDRLEQALAWGPARSGAAGPGCIDHPSRRRQYAFHTGRPAWMKRRPLSGRHCEPGVSRVKQSTNRHSACFSRHCEPKAKQSRAAEMRKRPWRASLRREESWSVARPCASRSPLRRETFAKMGWVTELAK